MMSAPSITRGIRHVAPLVLLLAAATACGPLRRAPGQAPAVIYFTNESLDQATVYVVAPGQEFRRIGTVFGGQTDTLTVPTDFALRGSLNIVARLLARSEVPQTGPVSIAPGGQYQVRLPINAMLISFLRVDP
jgi:hypothetical protein